MASYFVLLFLVYTWIAIDYTWKLRIWSPFDEIAQYDYIDKLSSGRFPLPTEAISDYSANLSINYFDWIKGSEFKGTKETMGIAGLSYEAQQPPFYYLVMAVPNSILKSLSVMPRLQVRVLREIGVFAQVCAAIIIGVCINKSRRFTQIHPIWSLIIPVTILIPSWEWRGPISNSNFALLPTVLSILFLLIYLEKQDNLWALGLNIFFTVLSFLTKYTYGLLLVLMIGFSLIMLWQNRKGREAGAFLKQMLLVLSPLLLVIGYLALNVYRFGFNDILGTKAVTNMFASLVTLDTWGFGLIRSLINTALTIPYLPVQPPWVIMFLAGCGLTIVQVAWLFINSKHRENSLYITSLGMVAIIMACSWLLTKISPLVDWGFFRHYFGFFGFWMIAALGFGFRPNVIQKVVVGILAIALAYPAVVYFLGTS